MARSVLLALAVAASVASVSATLPDQCLRAYLENVPAPEAAARVVGGQPLDVSRKYPFLVGIAREDNPIPCTGVLIHPRIVLTSAQCTHTTGRLMVFVGLHNGTEFDGCEEVFRGTPYTHEEYGTEIPYNDIGLIRLNRRSSYPVVASPATVHAPDGMILTVAGIGTTDRDDLDFPDIAQELDVTVVSDRKCKRTFDDLISPSMFCAGAPRAGPCYGDAGAPLFYDSDPSNPTNPERYTIVGLASWGDCALPRKPMVYTRVARFDRWIKRGIRGLLDGTLPPPPPADDAIPMP